MITSKTEEILDKIISHHNFHNFWGERIRNFKEYTAEYPQEAKIWREIAVSTASTIFTDLKDFIKSSHDELEKIAKEDKHHAGHRKDKERIGHEKAFDLIHKELDSFQIEVLNKHEAKYTNQE